MVTSSLHLHLTPLTVRRSIAPRLPTHVALRLNRTQPQRQFQLQSPILLPLLRLLNPLLLGSEQKGWLSRLHRHHAHSLSALALHGMRLRRVTHRRVVTGRPIQLISEATPVHPLLRLSNRVSSSFVPRLRPHPGPLEPTPIFGSVEIVCGGVLVLGNVTNVVGLERWTLAGGRCFRGDLCDGLTLEHRLHGGLAEVPASRPQQPNRPINGIHDPPTSLVEKRTEYGCNQTNKKTLTQ